ncbi:AtpZ/AtpI family protein [Acetatifactor aquisgranensis]|uniref:AtpZ/AtpI family protein n=1 Tax=Acetatifactor aquisgranensis TaxID=2941233 RepID=UPI00203BB192|nr:AtpZ/AtpI family protein [Acetatifactor aquisgranensis]MCI8541926.1 AtpZ/AtpI family protein [Lachnospiraceae bacterium]
MKRRKDDERIVYQSLAMITQFSLNMIVPIAMMCAVGIWLDSKVGTSWITILFFVIGAVAGGQNVYRMARRMCGGEEPDRGQGVSDEDDRSGEKDE